MTECPVMYQARWNGVFYNRVLHSNAQSAVLPARLLHGLYTVHRNKFIFFPSVHFHYTWSVRGGRIKYIEKRTRIRARIARNL